MAATICAAVLALAGLWAASAVMTPVAFALFILGGDARLLGLPRHATNAAEAGPVGSTDCSYS